MPADAGEEACVCCGWFFDNPVELNDREADVPGIELEDSGSVDVTTDVMVSELGITAGVVLARETSVAAVESGDTATLDMPASLRDAAATGAKAMGEEEGKVGGWEEIVGGGEGSAFTIDDVAAGGGGEGGGLSEDDAAVTVGGRFGGGFAALDET
ncbi:hypothetical protein GQ43DRAFT_472591 [Delitschia confertaspora ATCC 74209]|uniref:Uncharacterized protein n=1 Tax=Delitschia confertaspora ATCC 74209 TaxID=1513339 RepID=A0A9P4JPA2_9PLEO|nr:hypothetical protein GQ43DRAFT_472591 [Delitschia confertaspora ATCC 74209]